MSSQKSSNNSNRRADVKEGELGSHTSFGGDVGTTGSEIKRERTGSITQADLPQNSAVVRLIYFSHKCV